MFNGTGIKFTTINTNFKKTFKITASLEAARKKKKRNSYVIWM